MKSLKTYLKSAKNQRFIRYFWSFKKRGCSVAWSSIRGLGPLDPGSNPGSLIFKTFKKLKFPTLIIMATKQGSAARFGARYGKRVKRKVADVEKKQKVKKRCITCLKLGIKRLAAGIYYCPKCKNKFTGKAYEL